MEPCEQGCDLRQQRLWCWRLPGGKAQYQDRDTRGVAKTSATAPQPEARVDINHASVDELLKVPGMTRSWADALFASGHTAPSRTWWSTAW